MILEITMITDVNTNTLQKKKGTNSSASQQSSTYKVLLCLGISLTSCAVLIKGQHRNKTSRICAQHGIMFPFLSLSVALKSNKNTK